MTYLEFKLRLPELLLMRVDKIDDVDVGRGARAVSRSPSGRLRDGDPEDDEDEGWACPSTSSRRRSRACIPDDVIDRKKMGFGAPMREWLRGEFGRAAEQTVMHSALRAEGFFDYQHISQMFRRHREGEDFSLPLWTLYNLTAWFDHWVARSAAA